METSYKFKNIENNLLKLLEMLLKNEDLKKYIKYLTDNPLSESNVAENLISTRNIILAPFDEEILEEDKVIVFINPVSGKLNRQPLSEIIYAIEIIVPISKWLLNGMGQIRVYRIADLICQDIDQKRVMGITKSEVVDYSLFKVNSNFAGIGMRVKVNSSTMKGLR